MRGGERRVARQFGDQRIARADAVPLGARRQHLDLHLRHVDAGRAFAPAGLARHAQRHCVAQRIGRHRVGAELAGQRQAQRVGAAAREVLFVAGDAIGRAHHRASNARQVPLLLHISTAPSMPPSGPGWSDQSSFGVKSRAAA